MTVFNELATCKHFPLLLIVCPLASTQQYTNKVKSGCIISFSESELILFLLSFNRRNSEWTLCEKSSYSDNNVNTTHKKRTYTANIFIYTQIHKMQCLYLLQT